MTSTPDRGGPTFLTINIEHNEQSVWVRLRGTADIATLSELEVALARFDLDGQHSVQIDVSDLTFVDVAALRRLVSFAVEARRRGRDVTTRGARPALQRMADLLEVRDALGLA